MWLRQFFGIEKENDGEKNYLDLNKCNTHAHPHPHMHTHICIKVIQ